MNCKVWVLYIFFIVFFAIVASGQKCSVSGFVSDVQNGEKLLYATIYDKESHIGTVSNNYGYYSIGFNIGDTVTLVASYTGYKKQFKTIVLSGDINIDWNLVPGQELDEVEVVSSRAKRVEQRVELGVIELPLRKVRLLPAFVGEVDVMKTIQLLPGVSHGREGGNGLYVRGGTPDQNLILLDDVPLYYVNHIGGILSVFNTDALSDVRLIKGGFPARYGGRLSSILDIRMKEGNTKKYEGDVTIGILASKASFEGPIKRDTASFFISARRCMIDLFTRPLSRKILENTETGYTFYDLNLKLNFRLSGEDRIYLSAYKGRDRMFLRYKDQNEFESNNKWGNTMAALRWNHVFTPKLFSNLTLYYTQYKYSDELYYQVNFNDSLNSQQNFSSDFNSGLMDMGLKYDFDYYLNDSNRVRFGLKSVVHWFNTGTKEIVEDYASYDTSIEFKGKQYINSEEIDVYAEDEIQLGPFFSINAGLRGGYYQHKSTTEWSIEPRLVLNYMIAENSSIKASSSMMHQNIHLLTNSGAGMPTDLWVPVSGSIKPQLSYQGALGYAGTYFAGNYEFRSTVYYKQMQNLIEFKEGESFYSGDVPWHEKVEVNGVGQSYGVELFVQKLKGKTTGWVAYTLSKTDREFENLNLGNPFPFKYDQRHNISIVLNYQVRKGRSVSAQWVYNTGNALTIPEGGYSVIDHENRGYARGYMLPVFDYVHKNSFRIPSYHRFDIGFNSTKQKKHGLQTWRFGIYNVYNRKNPYCILYKYRGVNYYDNGLITKFQLVKFSLLQVMPSISYTFKF